MNYTNTNKVYDYWKNNIRPYVHHNFTVASFDDYLKKIAGLPSFKWLFDMESVRFGKLGFAVDTEKFLKTYENKCVTFLSPMKVEEGIQKIIYQITPTIHIDVSVWAWLEHNEVYSYSSLLACYHSDKEFIKFTDKLLDIRKDGNTEDKPKGFSGGF